MHWGDEHDPATDRQKALARKMIDAGATCVVGGHPHVVQETEHYKGKPIIYSVGNFVFNGFETPETNTGWALRMTLDKDGVAEWDTITARLDARGVPVPDLKARSPSGTWLALLKFPAMNRLGARGCPPSDFHFELRRIIRVGQTDTWKLMRRWLRGIGYNDEHGLLFRQKNSRGESN